MRSFLKIETMMHSIFDFDLSVTGIHTFKSTQLLPSQCPFSFDEQYYQTGIVHANFNLKANVKEYLKHDDTDNISAIATFHNNHSYIAGYMAFLFGRHLTLKEINFSYGGLSTAAIYQIEGITKPFIISYIPAANGIVAEDALFDLYIKDLKNNKNHQINHIRQIWHKLTLAQEDTPVSFYDDNTNNCKHAISMPFTKVSQVDKQNQGKFVFTEFLPRVSHSSASSADSTESTTTDGAADMPKKIKPGFFNKTGSVAHAGMSPSRFKLLTQIKEFVFDENHELVQKYLLTEASLAKFIAGFYAEAGNHLMAHKYIELYPDALQFVVQGYALVGNHDLIKDYYEQGLVTSDYIAGCYHRAGYREKSLEYKQLNSLATEGSSYRIN